MAKIDWKLYEMRTVLCWHFTKGQKANQKARICQQSAKRGRSAKQGPKTGLQLEDRLANQEPGLQVSEYKRHVLTRDDSLGGWARIVLGLLACQTFIRCKENM